MDGLQMVLFLTVLGIAGYYGLMPALAAAGGGGGGFGGDGSAGPVDIPALVQALKDSEFPAAWFSAADVLAVIAIESSFNPSAYRAEPQLGDGSYGLMQLLISTAMDRGYSGDPAGLYDPETNIRLGMAQLAWIFAYLQSREGHAPSAAQVVGAYNAGVGNALKGYTPLGYVARWEAARLVWKARGY